MGLFSRAKPPAPPARIQLARRSFMFDNMDSANAFMAAGGSSRRNGNLFGFFAGLGHYAENYGGSQVQSSTCRETVVYGYIRQVQQSDRDYLALRDPTAKMFIEKPAQDTWTGIPRTYIPAVDSYFSSQIRLGLHSALVASYQDWFQSGGALIYCETTGDPKSRIHRGERPLAWRFIPASRVIDVDEGEHGYLLTQPHETDPLLDHGIEYISFYPTESDKARNTPITVHGSRIVPIQLDPRCNWWRTHRIPLDAMHDDLWSLRDTIFAHTRAAFQGDPIVVDVDISVEAQALLGFDKMGKPQRDAMSADVEQAIRDFNTGAKDTFAPVMGYKIRRVGSAQLPDPEPLIKTICSRLAHVGPFTVKQVYASTKGNTDTGDLDLLIYAGNLQRIRDTFGYAHLSRILLMGRIMGANSLRTGPEFDLPAPTDLEWAPVRPLSPRDQAFIEKSEMAMRNTSWQSGYDVPPRIMRKFPKAVGTDELEPWLAAKGRRRDGRLADGKPNTVTAYEGGPPLDEDDIAEAVNSAMDARLEEELEAAVDAERNRKET